MHGTQSCGQAVQRSRRPVSRKQKVLNAGYEAKCNRCQRLPGGAARINADLEAGARVICEPCPGARGRKVHITK